LDTGIGLEKAEIARLFKPYNQANNEIQSEFGGTGLGLFICREILLKMRGDIHCESEKGLGSKFSMVIHTKVRHLS
jgi:signal transduction histidine kinase